MNKFKQQFCLWIHNCYHYSPLHGACSELLDCHIVLVCTEPWVVSPLVLCTLHHLQCRCHCFENASLGGCLLRQAGQPWGTLLLSGGIPQTSFLWGLTGDTGSFAVCVGLF